MWNNALHIIIVSFLWWQFIAAFAVSAGLHRFYSHAAFRAPIWYEYLVLFLAPFSGSGSVLGWVGIHRMHHKFYDTDKDPHSPKHVGIFRVLTSSFKVPPIPVNYVRDLIRNKRVVWFHRHHLRIRIITMTSAYILVPFPYFIAFFVLPLIYGYAGFGLLNGICHIKGSPQNSIVANILAGGEGWHHNHHKNPMSWKIGQKWWQIDTGALLIRLIKL
jgi:fatty-acid desaturase